MFLSVHTCAALPLDGEHRLFVQLRNRGPGRVPVRRFQGASHRWIWFGHRAEPQDQGKGLSGGPGCVCVSFTCVLNTSNITHNLIRLPFFYESLHVVPDISHISCIFPPRSHRPLPSSLSLTHRLSSTCSSFIMFFFSPSLFCVSLPGLNQAGRHAGGRSHKG